MYLPALQDHPSGQISMICGRNPENTADVAGRWGIAKHTTDWGTVVDECDAVIVAGSNDTHAEMALAVINAGKPLLLEKPVALGAVEAIQVADAADAQGVTTLVPFTYRWMPTFQWVKRLIDDGYIGRFHQLNLRYHTGYALDGKYAWRFDREFSGSGVIGDLGTHWLHYSRWWCGEVSAIGAVASTCVERERRPDGSDYDRCEDSAFINVAFENGGYGSLHVTSAAYEGDGFGQTHCAEIHGSTGTLHVISDWEGVQEVRGIRRGEPGRATVLPIPEDIWAGARRDTTHNTYRDVFRKGNSSARLWLSAAAAGERCQPDVREGARVQALADAAVASSLAPQQGTLLPV
jgi:predicted dehydrogenase